MNVCILKLGYMMIYLYVISIKEPQFQNPHQIFDSQVHNPSKKLRNEFQNFPFNYLTPLSFSLSAYKLSHRKKQQHSLSITV